MDRRRSLLLSSKAPFATLSANNVCGTLSGVNEKTDRFLRRTRREMIRYTADSQCVDGGGGRQQPSLPLLKERRDDVSRGQARDRARAPRNRNPKAAQ